MNGSKSERLAAVKARSKDPRIERHKSSRILRVNLQVLNTADTEDRKEVGLEISDALENARR